MMNWRAGKWRRRKSRFHARRVAFRRLGTGNGKNCKRPVPILHVAALGDSNLHRVEFDRPFAISRYEVTRGEFEGFVEQH